jgi:hypothetical protein
MSFLGYSTNEYAFTDRSLLRSSMKLGEPYYEGPARIICPIIDNKTFHAILAVDSSKNIITNSNSFLEDPNFVRNTIAGIREYDDNHTIMRRTEISYKYLLAKPVELEIAKEMFLLCNPFSATNVGHDISILLNRIHEYKQRKLTIPVVLSEFMKTIPRTIEICEALLPGIEFFYLPNNMIVKFQKLHIAHNEIFNIIKHPYLADNIVQHVINTPMIKENVEKYKDRKILLIKTNRNKSVVSKWSCFSAEKTIETLMGSYGYIYINPEETHMFEIIAYLYYASKIVTSFGAISYAHTIFFNPKIKYHYLKIQHNPYYYTNRHIIVNVSLNLDTQIPALLKALGE